AAFTALWARAGTPIAIAAGVGGVCGLFVLLAVRARVPRVSLVFSTEGVRFCGVDGVVECPWALFAARGRPFVEVFGMAVTLPIDASALPEVVHRRQGELVARGSAVRSRLFQVLSEREVRILGGFRVEPGALGAMLLEIGVQMGMERKH